MKTLIVYASMYGCTRRCAESIASNLSDAKVCSYDEVPSLTSYDRIIVGASIAAGSIKKPLKKWLGKNESELLKKECHIFICSGEEKADYINNNFSDKLLAHAKNKVFFGGEFKLSDAKGFTKFIMKLAGKAADFSNLKDQAITDFITSLNQS